MQNPDLHHLTDEPTQTPIMHTLGYLILEIVNEQLSYSLSHISATNIYFRTDEQETVLTRGAIFRKQGALLGVLLKRDRHCTGFGSIGLMKSTPGSG